MILSCSHQENTSKELDIIFVWPETPVNSNATFKCPKNSAIVLMRECTAGGQWGEFDVKGCGVLAKNFSNLAIGSKNVLSIHLSIS